ncbi:outer membrane protein TolC [Dyadobacter sp. BE34]|uniref:Outer membrane protein TolC n=1 Tax=Dyadobacter fermentans TaxID=94254 RepID=A0ABU1R6E9_9BACT|nr:MULTISPECIES: TolC family protein [Dyadobacter]MDR6808981.1 outer membrane protein TolC [Dyadobacter fermentans]MDR7046724.1 outer membrane protein TolC [Dyadobacter sp. BE242]MDR7201038.1 outer membrane protein TolC [Dyadobacter sp. BE34]MDR7218998.1 outer membrane protein TolC [Dyadobacter sp. BE31]MDR7264792.1 outer membrane protein TolC [Dyadobacter sp. BE32]
MINGFRIAILISVLALTAMHLRAQDGPLTIREAYQLARKNYPMIRQQGLIEKTRDYSVSNAAKGYLPQFTVQGQATYQSAVTEFKLPVSLPGVEFPSISKDQYKVYGEVNQTIYDGGNVRTHVRSHEANAQVESQKLEVELYKLNERVNQLFFGVLMLDEQLKQNDLLKKDINLGIRKVQALIDNGTAFKSNANTLKAELLKADQRAIDLNASRKAYLEMLGMLIAQPLSGSAVLEKPANLTAGSDINRPELKLYDAQNRSLDVQSQLLDVRNRPKLNFFFQGGYGRPALNILSNGFDPYYITGLRLNWSLSGLYTIKKDRELIRNNRDAIQLQKETFLFNTNLAAKQQNAELDRFSQLLQTDDEIITLRESIKTTAAAQLENGVINTNDFLREVNAEDQARLNKILHGIQLLMAQYSLDNTLGTNIE